jgi:hypothetical protein
VSLEFANYKENTQMANKQNIDAPVTVNLNSTYTANEGGQEVVPFHRDGETIVFAPVGSGRENRMRQVDFLKAYTLKKDEAR